MPKIKIFQITASYNEYEDNYRPLIDSETEWEEVSKTELEKLQTWIELKNKKQYSSTKIILAEALSFPEIKHSVLKDYQNKMEHDLKAEEKRKETAKKRRVTAAKKTLEKKKKLLAELKEELGEN